MPSRWLSGHETVTRYLSAIDALLSPVTPSGEPSPRRRRRRLRRLVLILNSLSRAPSFSFLHKWAGNWGRRWEIYADPIPVYFSLQHIQTERCVGRPLSTPLQLTTIFIAFSYFPTRNTRRKIALEKKKSPSLFGKVNLSVEVLLTDPHLSGGEPCQLVRRLPHCLKRIFFFFSLSQFWECPLIVGLRATCCVAATVRTTCERN